MTDDVGPAESDLVDSMLLAHANHIEMWRRIDAFKAEIRHQAAGQIRDFAYQSGGCADDYLKAADLIDPYIP